MAWSRPTAGNWCFAWRHGEDSAIYTAAIGSAGLSAPVGTPSLVVSARVLSEFDISPDGRFVAYSSRETGVDSVFVTRFPVADGKWEVPVRLAVFPRWSAKGDRLFVFDELSRLVEVPVDLGRSFAAGVPAVRLSGLAVQVTAGYDRFPDGTSFIVPLAPAATTSATQVQVLVIRNGCHDDLGRTSLMPSPHAMSGRRYLHTKLSASSTLPLPL